MAPRRKKNSITIQSKEVRTIAGLFLIGLGTTVLLADTLSGSIPSLIFYMFGQGILSLGIFLILLGFRLMGLKHTLTSSQVLTGLLGLTVVYVTFLAYLSLGFSFITSPGLVGVLLNEYLWNIFGKYMEGVVLFIFASTFLSLITSVKLLDIIGTGILMLGRALISFVNMLIGRIRGIRTNTGRIKELVGGIKHNIPISKQTSTEHPEINIEGVSAQNIEMSSELTKEHTGSVEKAQSTVNVKDQSRNNTASAGREASSSYTQTSNNTSPTNISVTFGPSLIDKTKQQGDGQDDTVTTPELERFVKLYSKRFPNWEFPDLKEVLLPPQKDSISSSEIEEVSRKIEEVLDSFRIHARVSKVFVGPSVIQYALNIATGVKVAKVKGLAKDIALAIAAPSGAIRIEPISGTSLIGIEVPRRNPRIVRASEVLLSPEFGRTDFELPLALGKNILGRPVFLNLYDMPHLLIAGATGSGKSVAINLIISGLLSKYDPDSLRLIMVDPKMVEMEPYNDIPHLLVPVITDMNYTVMALDWLIFEMQERYKLFKRMAVRNLKEYNAKAHIKLPWIVLVIDEMADLILTKRNEVESKIVRLAQLARATGIHLILATQRPSVNVITGLIKANIPARIALAVASGVDSRVIIDTVGAESLLGKGDMLVKTPNSTRLERVQGAFISTDEVTKLTSILRNQAMSVRQDKDWYVTELMNIFEGKQGIGAEGVSPAFGSASSDPLLKDAIELVVREQKVSASALQRYLKIGFNRAARLIDEMERLGIVSPVVGNKRKVLISDLNELNL